MDILLNILSKCICGCKSDCCEKTKQTKDKKTKKKLFHIEASIGKKKHSNTPSISSID